MSLVLASMLVGGAFLVLMGRLFEWRFAVGDMYPPYSTLRADPLGAKAFYESLDRMPGLQVRHHLRSAQRLPSGSSASVFVLGLPLSDLRAERDEILGLEKFVQSGGRLVLALHAGGFEPSDRSLASGSGGRGAMAPAQPSGSPVPSDPTFLDLRSRWDFDTRARSLSDTNHQRASLVVTGGVANISFNAVIWRSRGVLIPEHADWQPVLSQGSNTVVLRRSLGLGTVVICTDSYPFSNEGLRSNPAPEFLAWLVGNGREILFDEAHLGIQEAPGTASLARRYRLELPFLTLCFLAALVIWRGASRFSPRQDGPDASQPTIRGRSLSGGFVGLLRRNIPPQDLLALCLKEWKQSRFGGRSITSARLARVQEIIDRENLASGSGPDPVRIYREIAEVLSAQGSLKHSANTQPPLAHDH